MPVTLPDLLPAINILKKENIFVMTQLRAQKQDIRPLRILILNLMPVKVVTETDLVRLLSNTPLQINIEFLRLSTHQSRNTPVEHLEAFYNEFKDVKADFYDGMIVTGAPVECIDFSEVTYWNEITTIIDWAKTHVTSTIYICWAAQAALYRSYGIPKYPLNEKKFGVFQHTVTDKNILLFRGFDDVFQAPHSRHTEIRKEDIEKHAELKILSTSEDAGIYIVMGRGGREFYITGHSEYSLLALHNEYMRDIEKGLAINMPTNYYKKNDPKQDPLLCWAGHGHLLFNNWINYYLYQETPFVLSEIANLGHIIS